MSVGNRLFKTSIGRKYIMGVSGLALCLFAFVHMSGNFLLFSGAEAFNAYADFLHSIPGFRFIEIGLLVTFLLHIGIGIQLAYENKKARPQAYAMKKSAGVATIGSATMPYTGIAFLVFLVVHLLNFKFKIFPTFSDASAYDTVAGTLSMLPYTVFYVVGVVIIGIHLTHGLQSSFQSLGWNSPKYMPQIRKFSVLYGIIIAVGYGILPIFIFLSHGGH